MSHDIATLEADFNEICTHVYNVKAKFKSGSENLISIKADLSLFFSRYGLHMKNVSENFKVTFYSGDTVTFKNWGEVTLTPAKQ